MLIDAGKAEGRTRKRRLKDYAGQRFGRLVAVSLVSWDGRRPPVWRFKCDCGGGLVANVKNVVAGNTQSCGCIRAEMLRDRNATHGLSRAHPREYRSWKDMRGRCLNPRQDDYADYGGRGIRICGRWDDFAAFLADMGPRPKCYTLDRIDVDGHYEPSNCRWATAKTQANNKRSNQRITYNGETRTLQEWSDHFGLERTKVQWRLQQGWPMDRVFSSADYRMPGS